LLVEPCLDLVLFLGREFLVGIIDMAVKLEQGDLEYSENASRKKKKVSASRRHTISSLQMGHRRLDAFAAPPFGCAPTLILEPIS
jgi:hypothetical protein